MMHKVNSNTRSLVTVALCTLACLPSLVAAWPAWPFSSPKVVTDLDISKYTGRWYQMYASPSVYATFEKNAKCVTADYATTSDASKISVYNAMQDTKTNASRNITGVATIVSPGKLNVEFGSAGFIPKLDSSNYWVYAVGPVVNNRYDWAIVSDRFKAFLFVLARDQNTFASTYGADVLKKAKDFGFTSFINKPVATVHDSTCVYPA